jgi:DNA-binding CsgD family transcriptional regulator
VRALLDAAGGLYAAALDPVGWPTALDGMVSLVDCDHGMLAEASAEGPIPVVTTARLADDHLRLFMAPESVRLLDPYRVVAPHGVAVSSRQILPDAEFARSAIYNEVIRPTGTFHSIFAQGRGPTDYFLNLCRVKTRPFDADETAIVQMLLPHLATAIEFRRRLRGVENGRSGLVHLLDRLTSGVILTDARARLCFVNRRASMLAEEGDGLRFTADGLAGAAPGATRALRDAVALMSVAESTTSRRLQLTRPSRLPLLLSLMPAWRLGAAVSGVPTPTVAIFITEPDAPGAIDRVALADVLGLARRESEVVALLAEGDSLAEIADMLGLTVGAVRQYLKRAFDKTGRHSQAALVALARGFVSLSD